MGVCSHANAGIAQHTYGMYVCRMTPTVRPAALGESHEVALDSGTIRYFESGPSNGPVAVFVHGLLVNADLWRQVVPGLVDAGFRYVTPSTGRSAPTASRCPGPTSTPPGVADLIARVHRRDSTSGRHGGGQRHRRRAHPDPHDPTPRADRSRGAPPSDSLRAVLPADCSRCLPTAREGSRRDHVAAGPGALVAVRAAAAHRVRVAHQAADPAGDRAVNSYVLPAVATQPSVATCGAFLRTVSQAPHPRGRRTASPSFDPPGAAGRGRPTTGSFRSAWPSACRGTIPNATTVPIVDSLTFVPEDQPAVARTAGHRVYGAECSA